MLSLQLYELMCCLALICKYNIQIIDLETPKGRGKRVLENILIFFLRVMSCSLEVELMLKKKWSKSVGTLWGWEKGWCRNRLTLGVVAVSRIVSQHSASIAFLSSRTRKHTSLLWCWLELRALHTLSTCSSLSNTLWSGFLSVCLFCKWI